MAPPAQKLEAALIDATCEVFKTEPDATSVNKVRRQAEESLDLEEGFFTSAQWKQKSKTLIKEYVEKLLDGWVPEPKKEEAESKNGVKRQSSEPESSAPKRRKRSAQPKKSIKEESDLSDLSEEEKPKKAKSATRRKPKAEALDPDEDEEEDIKASPPADRKRKRAVEDESEDETKVKKAEGSDSDELSSPPEDEIKIKNHDGSDEDEKPSIDEDDTKPAVDEEEEYSDVVDEAPKPKRKVKEKKGSVKKEAKPIKKEPKKAPSPDDPNETEIKKLQAQLVKCGVRKLWHNELKKYGDDARAKIRHLKKMLTDVGMDGRFSEARAREIKETRELMAEAEAAQEMNALWGMDAGGRASRSKAKGQSMKVEESEGSDGGEGGGAAAKDEDDEDEDMSFAARRRRAQADLAFLGDESESD